MNPFICRTEKHFWPEILDFDTTNWNNDVKVPEISEENNQEEFKPYKRPRRDYTIEQKEVLEKEFETKKYLDLDEMNALAKQLDLEYDQVKNWFSGRRSKWNSEVDDPLKQIRRRKPNKKQKGSHNR